MAAVDAARKRREEAEARRVREQLAQGVEKERQQLQQLLENRENMSEAEFVERRGVLEETVRAKEELQRTADRAEETEAKQRALESKMAKKKNKKSELMKKRREMENKMKEEEAKLNELTTTAKEKVRAQLMTEEAKKDAVQHMEKQAQELVARREELEQEIAVKEAEKQEQMSVLEQKMEMEAQELTKLSQEARDKLAAKMKAEADAIAEMARKQHFEAEAHSELVCKKKKELEAKMVQEEQELAELSRQARKRVEEKMQAEAAAIAQMEREAQEMAAKRSALEEQQRQWQAYEASGDKGYSEEYQEEQVPPRHSGEGGVRFLQSSKSLYDLIATEGANGDNLPTRIEEGEGEDEEAIASAQEVQAEDLNGLCAKCIANRGELQVPHFAAAMGHLECLHKLHEQAASCLTHFDQAGRNPLFYACANGHTECAEFLLQHTDMSCGTADASHDTPLHAAAAAGSAECVQLLLQQGNVDVEARNAMGMTAAHLGKTREVLEVLLAFGSSVNNVDKDQRTPLFLACATGRVEIAEFLCDLLDCNGEDLSHLDKRGDSPLHAAACNGNTACLVLLLQYGVQPDQRNKKGLRPIDLAARRGHAAAEKVLLEYHLHHTISDSYFDSVLFLATLEGHKKCKEVLTDTGDSYEIVKPAQAATLEKTGSMWSLRRGRSVRLQQYGDWIAYEDQNVSSVFWYNHVTQTTQWQKPEEVVAAQQEEMKAQASKFQNLAGQSMRLKREGEWITYSMEGKHFYYNDSTHEFQWERPAELAALPGHEGGGEGAGSGARSSGWEAYKDPNTGLVFWYHQETGASQWEPPEGVDIEGQGEEEQAHSGSYHPDIGDNVHEVTTLDDLGL
ncbi:unnamed protein product [Chrysoparadoxa australica]